MIQHSTVFEDFLIDPQAYRDSITTSKMGEHMGSDGVMYPGIVELSEDMQYDLGLHFKRIYGLRFKKKLMFARHSYEKMHPPHWAHSDLNMAQYVALIYLSPVDYPWDGTYCVKHKATGMETHPENQEQIDILMKDSNEKLKWDVTYTCPSKFNRCFVLDARYIHAAAYKFGDERDNSRLVLSVFYDLI